MRIFCLVVVEWGFIVDKTIRSNQYETDGRTVYRNQCFHFFGVIDSIGKYTVKISNTSSTTMATMMLSSAAISATAVASTSSRRFSVILIRRSYPERGCHNRRISSWMATRTTTTETSAATLAAAISKNPVVKCTVRPALCSTPSSGKRFSRYFLNHNRSFSIIHQYTDDEIDDRDRDNDTTNNEDAGINKADDDKAAGFVDDDGISEPKQWKQNQLQERVESSPSDEEDGPSQESPHHFDQGQRQQQQQNHKQPHPYQYGNRRQKNINDARKYDSRRYQLIDKWLPVRKHLRRITGIEHKRHENRELPYEQRQQRPYQQTHPNMSPLFTIPVPHTSWIRIMGVFPTTTLDEVVQSIETQLREEAFLDYGDNDDHTISGGILDLDAYWNPMAVVREGDPHCKSSLPNILDRRELKTEDDVCELFKVKSAHVILSPFGRPCGWDVELSNQSMVYALLLRSKQADIISDIRKKDMLKQRRERMRKSSSYKYNNNKNNNFGSSGTIDGEESSPDGNNSATATAELHKISWTIQDAVQEHLQVWMKQIHHETPQINRDEDDSCIFVDEDEDMDASSTSRDYNEETVETSAEDDADDHRNDGSSDQDGVLEAIADEDNDEKVLEAGIEELNAEEELDAVDGKDNIANDSIGKDDSTQLDYVAMGDRRIRIGWKSVHVKEVRSSDIDLHRGDAAGRNRNRNLGYAEADVQQSGVIYNVDRFRNQGIPIVVDDSMVRFENCPRGMNMEQLRLLLSRYDLAEQPASDGNTIVSWKQKTEDGKSHRMFIARFADASWARAAIRELQGTIIGGKVVRLVQFPKQMRFKSGEKN